jgi:hypothetical protein
MAEAVNPTNQNPLTEDTGQNKVINVPDTTLPTDKFLSMPLIESIQEIPAGIKGIVEAGVNSRPIIDLNRSLYGNEFLENITQTIKGIQAPKVEAQTFDNLGLSEAQTELLNQTSQNIAGQTNQVIQKLQDSFIRAVRGIEQASQDRAITSGQIIGELGSPAETSSRNLSFVADAQARGQQQILDTSQDFLNQVQQAFFSGQQNLIQVGQQAINLQNQDIERARAEADRLTQTLGELYVVDEQGNIVRKLDENGNPIPTLEGQKFDLEERKTEQEIKEKQLDIASKQFQNSQYFTTDENGNFLEPTELGKLIMENQIGQQQVNKLNLEQQKKYLEGLQDFATSSGEISEIATNLQSDDPNTRQKAYDKITELQQKNGSAFLTYWSTGSPEVKTDKDGNVTGVETGKAQYNSEGLGTLGLFLNVAFDSPAYRQAIAGLKENERPDYLFAEEVKKAIMEGDSVNSLNKIYLESDDDNIILLGLKNTDQSGENYKFKLIDTSQLDDVAKNDLKNKLAQIDQRNALALQNAVDAVAKNSKAIATDLAPSEFIEVFLNSKVSDDIKFRLREDYKAKTGQDGANLQFTTLFNQAKNNRISEYLPKNSELLPLVLAGVDRGTLQILKEEKIVNEKDLSLVGLNIITSTTLNPLANAISNNKGLTGLSDEDIKKLGGLLRGEAQKTSVGKSTNLISYNSGLDLNTTLQDNEEVKNMQKKIGALAKIKQQLNAKGGNNNQNRKKYYNEIFKALILASSPQQNMQEAVAVVKIVDAYLGEDISKIDYSSAVPQKQFVPPNPTSGQSSAQGKR